MEAITLDHVRAAAEWAQEATEPKPLDGEIRRYKQTDWDCGTACCMWGAASLIAHQGRATEGPSEEWANQSILHLGCAGVMRSGGGKPEQILALLSGAGLSGADLRDADLRDADLSGANLRGANLRGANLRDALLSGADLSDADLRDADLSDAGLSSADLRGADLSGADLSGAKIWLGNRQFKLEAV